MAKTWVGHQSLIPKLTSIIGSSGGAFLFQGPPSTGKRTVAFSMAEAALCEKSSFDECTCQSCRAFSVGEHPDFMSIGHLDSIHIEDIDRVLEFASTRPFLSKKRAVVINNAEEMSVEANNRLLKTIEEPATGMYFILVTSSPQRLLPTIRGRCIPVNFDVLSMEDLTNVFWQKMGYELTKARVLGWVGAGASFDIFANAGHVLKYRDEAYNLFADIKKKKLIDCLDLLDRIPNSDVPIFTDLFLIILTDLLVLKYQGSNIANVDIQDGLKVCAEEHTIPALTGVVNSMSQVKKYRHLNVNLSATLKAAFISIYPAMLI